MLDEIDTKLSKEISYALRHNPSAYGLSLDDNGRCDLDDLVDALNAKKVYGVVDADRIVSINDNSDKRRFEIDEDNHIRALYGHSLKEHPILVSKPVVPPGILYHGTSRRAWEKIRQEGLKPMSRQHVHLSTDLMTAQKVGQRHDENPVILVVRAHDAFLDNVKFYHSSNDPTWMSEPIPLKYIRELRPLTKEYVEETELKLHELEREIFRDEEFNSEAFFEKQDVLFMLSIASKERVAKILDMFKTFPPGRWRCEGYPGIEKYLSTIEGNPSSKPELNLRWYSNSERMFGFEFVHGYDDGYPETTAVPIPAEMLYLDDDVLEKRITTDVLECMDDVKSKLGKELDDATHVLKDAKCKIAENESIASKSPFSVEEICSESVRYADERPVAYNIVDKNGDGLAVFGSDRTVAQWFCDAANEKAKVLLRN